MANPRRWQSVARDDSGRHAANGKTPARLAPPSATRLPVATAKFWGNMAEIVHYDRPLGDSERNQIESYLAFKYGLTLDAGVDYVDSSGAVVWDATANAQYHHAVRGLVRDDLTNLNLLQAYPSVESTTLMTITHGNDPSNPAPFANDGTYMVVGHNGVSSGSHLELISGITTIWYSGGSGRFRKPARLPTPL